MTLRFLHLAVNDDELITIGPNQQRFTACMTFSKMTTIYYFDWRLHCAL